MRAGSFDHLVGDGEQARRKGQTEYPGSVEVDHEFEFVRLHDRQIGWPLTFQNPGGIDADLAMRLGDARPVAHQAADIDKLPEGIDRRYPMVSSKRSDLNATIVGQWAAADQQCINRLLRKARKDRVQLAAGRGMQYIDLFLHGRR